MVVQGRRLAVFIFTGTAHYRDLLMSGMASKITSITIVYSTVYSGADQRKHQSSASLAFVRGIHRRPVIFSHKGPVARKVFPFDDVIVHIMAADTLTPCVVTSSANKLIIL